jgi:hypothetical protein
MENCSLTLRKYGSEAMEIACVGFMTEIDLWSLAVSAKVCLGRALVEDPLDPVWEVTGDR